MSAGTEAEDSSAGVASAAAAGAAGVLLLPEAPPLDHVHHMRLT